MIKRFLTFVLIGVFGYFFVSNTPLLSANEETSETSSDTSKEEIEAKIEDLENKIQEAQGQKRTLANTIGYLNGKISLTQAQIDQTQSQLEKIRQDIGSLNLQIDQLNASLDAVSQLLINRIKQTYIRSQINPLQSLITSGNLSRLLTRYKYLQLTQQNDRQIMYQMENTRLDFNQQKVLKEEKQVELDELGKKLDLQQGQLTKQQKEKEVLLEITNNDEKRFQKLLAEAKAQLAAFRRFTSSQGGASILKDQTHCDDWGCYYSQRDSQWGLLALGDSDSSVAEYGCFVSSVAMLASHQGLSIKPSDIALTKSAFFSDTAYLLWDFKTNSTHITISSASKYNLDSLLEKGPVIAGLYSGPDHFIVVKKKEGDDYIINDPFAENGHDILLSDEYSYGAISSLRLVSFD